MDPAFTLPVDLGEGIAELLRTRILSGTLAPGSRLVETALADSFGTSRGPVRDAIGRLAATGLVTVHPRRGAYVASFDTDDVEEIYSLRIALETVAVRRAARHGDADDWAEMDLALAELQAALDDDDGLRAGTADMRFHRTIVRAARHQRLATAWEAFADQTLLLLKELSGTGADVQASPDGHAQVLLALRDTDGARAETFLVAHLQEAQAAISARFQAMGR